MTKASALAVALAATMVPASLAQVFHYTANLDGPSESPPNNSPGTGAAHVTWDAAALTMRVQATFTGLLGTTTAAHIHGLTAAPFDGTASVATTTPTFPGFPLGVTSGSMDMTFDLTQASTFNASFITANGGTVEGARDAFFLGLNTGRTYFNIHTTQFPGGEIRGFLVPGAPTAALGVGLLALASRRRRG